MSYITMINIYIVFFSITILISLKGFLGNYKVFFSALSEASHIHRFNSKRFILLASAIMLIILFECYIFHSSGREITSKFVLAFVATINAYLMILIYTNSFIMTRTSIVTLFRCVKYEDVSNYDLDSKSLSMRMNDGSIFIARLAKDESLIVDKIIKEYYNKNPYK